MTENYRAKAVAATFFRTPFIGTECSNFPHLETKQHEPEAAYYLMHRVYARQVRDISSASHPKSVNRAAPKARLKVKDELDM